LMDRKFVIFNREILKVGSYGVLMGLAKFHLA
jgi:hypothetical protein